MTYKIARFELQTQHPDEPFKWAAAIFVPNTDLFRTSDWKETDPMPPERLAEIDIDYESVSAIVSAAIVAQAADLQARTVAAESLAAAERPDREAAEAKANALAEQVEELQATIAALEAS